MSIRCLIDANVFDKIVDEPGMLERVRRLTNDGSLALLVTSRQALEVARTQPPRREALERVPTTVIGSAPFLLGVSQVGVDRLGPEEPFQTLRGHHTAANHLEDHLGVATAELEGLPFVTEEGTLRDHARTRAGIEAWSWADLRRRILELDETATARGPDL